MFSVYKSQNLVLTLGKFISLLVRLHCLKVNSYGQSGFVTHQMSGHRSSVSQGV